ncbi:MoaD/ThiS family protein [Cellulomonas xiejunii]|uniref:Molybdopterin synthase sulfur carrier subunit n=1 Tax=Cellulomonas xiejunii TaxID=2968083 RepID=A0ABY5KUW0_9CELL|nr:MoaD/ThiS family protein [Cellulomonas xiejunii]MCC2314757.1 MoaD/ThiS family protein [Cellulomonas xiejunii]MCC2323019.1 MoaD/ThiS family protein [Cellulomonas xiejunii]UUI73515.1 MoaD/ThiS family protein [Cellulomonas xiejunii]
MTTASTTGQDTVTLVEVRYFAAAAEAAGCDAEHVAVPPGTRVGALLDALAERHGPALGEVAARCALLVDGVLHRDRDEPLGAPHRVDVLPPFAGG